MGVYSVEPCHPMGFWGRRTHAELSDSGLDTIAATAWLESNARALIERSVARSAYVAGGLLGREDVALVDFLLDDQFASAELMGLLPPERVAEMLSDGWARHGGRLYRGDRFSCSMPAPAMSSRHLYTEHRRGHIQPAPRLRAHRGGPLSRDHPQIPVSMPSLFRFDASAIVHTCSSSHRTPAPLTARRQPQR